MKIAIGCDEAAFQLKEQIKEHIQKKNIDVVDFGTYDSKETVLYPKIAQRVAESVVQEKQDYGILICGTGIGMAISACKVPGILAAVCHDVYSTVRSKKSNNCNIMCMGARVIGIETAKSMVDLWLNSDFAGGGSQPKVDAISDIERKYTID